MVGGTHRWFSLPVDVPALPAQAQWLPVSVALDFDRLLETVGEAGTADERTLSLVQRLPDGRDVEVPIQFSPTEQPRHAERRLLPDTPPTVSWVAEWAANARHLPPRVGGTLCFGMTGWTADEAHFQLRFGVPLGGSAVQVPFPPHNLHHFDVEGRARPPHWFPRMQLHPQWPLDGVIDVTRDGAPLASYHLGPWNDAPGPDAARRPYFYPVYGPDGVALTEFGKPHDPTGSHAHHYSLWLAHAKVAGVDFWSERGGRIYHRQLELQEDGPLFARLVQRLIWRDTVPLLSERRQITVFATPEAFRVIDLELEFSAIGMQPVELGQTPFGFLAARTAQSMAVFDGGGEIVNALGQRNEQEAHWQHAPWIDQSGPIAPDRWGGIALFDHPGNPRYPTAWHCRNDGWAGAAFTLERPWLIGPGEALTLRYRVLLHQHDVAGGAVASRYAEYVAEPGVRLGPLETIEPPGMSAGGHSHG